MSWHDEKQAELAEKQAGKTRQQVVEELKQDAEHVFDPETAAPQKHNWVDRGLIMSCEGAGHPNHQTGKRRMGERPM